VPAPVVARRRSRERVAWVLAAVLAAIAVGTGALAVVHLRERPATPDLMQFAIASEPNSALATPADFAISPDGRQMVFVASQSHPGTSAQPLPMLWVRPLSALVSRALPGTEGALSPFWSPDSRQIGFFAAGKLKKVDAAGGPPVALCAADGLAIGGTWNR